MTALGRKHRVLTPEEVDDIRGALDRSIADDYRYHPLTVAWLIDTLDAATPPAEGLGALLREPHHLGYPVSGRTGTYDRDTVMVKRDWYERLCALAREPE